MKGTWRLTNCWMLASLFNFFLPLISSTLTLHHYLKISISWETIFHLSGFNRRKKRAEVGEHGRILWERWCLIFSSWSWDTYLWQVEILSSQVISIWVRPPVSLMWRIVAEVNIQLFQRSIISHLESCFWQSNKCQSNIHSLLSLFLVSTTDCI